MKTWLRKNLALFLTLCMCLSLFTVSVAAENTDNPITAETMTAQPLDSTANEPVTVTTANIFPVQSNTYFTFEGLPADKSLYLHICEGTGIDYHVSLHSDSNGFDMWSNSFGFEAGEHTFTLTVCDRNKTPLYESVSITVEYAETIPVTLEELQTMGYPTELSPMDDSFRVEAYMPVGTLSGEEDLRFEVAKDGVRYAVSTVNNRINVSNSDRVEDSRYHDIFGQEAYVPLPVQSARCYVYCGRTLTNGTYDVNLYDGNTLLTSWEGAVCTSDPIVSFNCYNGATGAYNIPGSEAAGCTLSITNGDPADFRVKLKKQGEVIGTSTDYRVIDADDVNCRAVYYIELDEPLERYQEYEINVSYLGDGSFTLESSDPYLYVQQKGAADRERIQFGSYYFANFVIPSQGYDAGVKYRFELMEGWDEVVATTYASPNNEGVFSVEFRDDSGDLIELEEYQDYQIEFYGDPDNPNYSSASWQVYNSNLRRETAEFSLLGAEETVVLKVENCGCWQADQTSFTVQLMGDREDITDLYNNKNQCQLRLTSVTGVEYLMTASNNSRLLDDGTRAYLMFTVPEDMDDAYYTAALLFNDKLVVNENEENIFRADQMLNFSTSASAGIGVNRMHEISAAHMIDAQNLDGKELTVELFSLTNRTSEPDHTLTFAEDDDLRFSARVLAELNPAAKYQAVISADGKVMHVTEYMYWISEEALDKVYGDCGTAKVAEGMEDYLEIVPCYTNYDEDEGIPYFSEVYVNVSAPEGKALQYITVNGEKICGNGFLFTEDCEVSAIFAEPETETYKATVQMGVYEYVYENGMTEEDAWKHAESLSPEEMEAFYASLGNSRRVFKVLYSYERNLPPNSMQEIDLSLPANLNNYKVGYIDVECADPQQWSGVSHNDAQTRWFLDMPECDVVVKVELAQKQKYAVSTYYDSSLGTITGLDSDYQYVTEGETVSFTAVPNNGNLLQSVYYEYYDYRNGGNQHIEITPNAGGVYSFVMPSNYVTLYVNFTTSGPYNVNAYAYGMGSVSVSDPASEKGYMAGEVVTLTVTPNEGYRLVPKDGLDGIYWIGYNTYELEFTKANDTTYTFVVPNADVSIEAHFEKAPAIAPGGTVVDNDTLIAALGGEANASLNTETGAVQLLKNVELQSPILFNPTRVTEFILDLNGHRIVAVENNSEESGAIILHQNGLARLTLDSTKDDAVITTDGLPRNNFHLIWVRGGKLTVAPQEYICFYGAYSYHERSSAGIRVAGGVVDLMENFEVHGNGSGEAVWASSGTTTINGGAYFAGVDYYNQLAGELNLLGGFEEYDWVTSRSLGGSGIRVSGRAKVELLGEEIWATGGPNGAALHIDNGVAVDTPCEVNVYGGSYTGDYGKGLLVQSAAAKLTIHVGEFHGGYPYNADYSVDVSDCGVVVDYLAPDRKVENLDRYLGYENGENIYAEMTEEELQRSYLYDDIRVSDGPITATNAELDKMWEELPEELTDDTIAEIQQAVSKMDNLAEALEKDTPDNSSGTTEKLAKLEEAIGKAEIKIENEAFQIDNAQASITGAVINAGGDVTLNIAQAQVSEKEEISEVYQNAQHFSLTLMANNEEITLSTPVKVVLPVPANVNPALLMILHYNEQNEQNQKWEIITPTVYQVGERWYMTFVADSFSDFALSHKVSVLKDSENEGIWVTLDVHQNAAEDQQFLCAIYSEQGQMLRSAVINDDTFIKLGSEYYSAYELKLFTVDANGTWTPKYSAETISLNEN